ncbi:MAG TPA: putative Ig domain-containing protein [Bryobacteraceae bacterium]|jgi:hypothetical protein
MRTGPPDALKFLRNSPQNGAWVADTSELLSGIEDRDRPFAGLANSRSSGPRGRTLSCGLLLKNAEDGSRTPKGIRNCFAPRSVLREFFQRSVWLLAIFLIFSSASWAQLTPLTVTTPCPAPPAMQNQPYSLAITVTGAAPGPISFTLNGTGLPPGLSLNSPGTISGIPTVSGTFSVSVMVEDSVGQIAYYDCAIVVGGTLSLTTACPITAIPAPLTATGGSGAYTFSIIGSLPASLTLSGGVITGTLTASPGTYTFTLQVTDGLQTAVEPCSIVISPPIVTPLSITSACPASPIPQGTAFSFTLSATGGVGGYIWSILPSLPSGLTLSANVISGTPAGPQGTFSFTVQVSSGAETTSIPCSLTISPPVLLFTSACPGNGTVGVAYKPFVLTATGGLGAGTYIFSLQGTLPPGLSFSTNTISGIPTAAGTYAFGFTVVSGLQTVVSPGCSVIVAPAPLGITASCPAGTLTVGSPVSIPFAVTGGKPPYKFTVSGASWLTISTPGAAAGIASGTPGLADIASFTVTVSVTDATPTTASSNPCNFTVSQAPLQIGGSCPMNPVTPGSPVSVPLTASGGVPPYAWVLKGNSGLTLASMQGATDSLTGNAPASSGAYTFTLTLSDSASTTPATLSCTLNVQLPPLQIAGACPAVVLSLPVTLSIPLSASGGKAPYTWTLSSPSWISLNSTTGAAITLVNSAAPSAAGAFSFSVTLSDSASSTPVVFSCNSSITFPPVPSITVTGLTLQPTLLTTLSPGIQLSSAPLLPLTGTVQITFAPNAFGITDNPQVSFNGGSRTASFTIPPGQTSYTLPAVQQGTDAGTIQLEVTDLQQGGVEVLGTPHPSADLVIPRMAPVVAVTDVSFADETTNGFNIVINGYSTPRDMSSVTLMFTAASGQSLSGPTSFTIDVSALFTAYYSSAASQLVGSQWLNLNLPVTTTGSKAAIGSVAVTLSNSAGSSQTITLSR